MHRLPSDFFSGTLFKPLDRVNSEDLATESSEYKSCPIKIKFQCVRRISAASVYVLKSHSIAYLESAVPAWHHEQEAACMTSSLLVTTAPAAKTRRTQRCPCLETLQQLHASLCTAREVRPTPCGSRHIPTWASPSRVCLGPPAQLPESHQPYTTSPCDSPPAATQPPRCSLRVPVLGLPLEPHSVRLQCVRLRKLLYAAHHEAAHEQQQHRGPGCRHQRPRVGGSCGAAAEVAQEALVPPPAAQKY